MTFALVLLLACQDDVYIRKIDKVRYIEATAACREAEAKLESDENFAIEKLSRIIGDGAITEVECNLRIQVSDIYGPPYLFLPYQYRARARISLAGKTSAAVEKKLLLEDAVRDLKVSVGKKVASSAKLLESAQAELTRVSAPSTPPVAPPPTPTASPEDKLRPLVGQLIRERKFKSAQAAVERDGAGLSSPTRAALLAEAGDACRSLLTEEMLRFRRALSAAALLADLQAMSKDEFENAFALPDPKEIAVAFPSYEWARANLETLRLAWSGKATLPSLLQSAAAAASLEEAAWFKLAEGYAFQEARRIVESRIAEAADAPKAKRDPLVAEAQAAMKAWEDFTGRVPAGLKPQLEASSKTLASALDRKPKELPALDAEDLRTCFDGAAVEDRLVEAEQRLTQWAASGQLTVEARQKLHTLKVAARAYRLFLSGKSDDDVAAASRDDLEKLSKLGGALDPDRFGPRIRKVFDSLR